MKTTFISFCVDIGRDKIPITNTVHRDFEVYQNGMTDNISTYLPLNLFTSIPEDKIFLPNHRNELNYNYNLFTIDNIEKEFPDIKKYDEYYYNKKIIKDEICQELYYYSPLVTLKMKKMIDTIDTNPFNSDYFVWIDSYFERGMPNPPFYSETAVNEWSNKIIEKSEDKLLLFVLDGYNPLTLIGADFKINHNVYPFGFFWGGHKDAIKNVFEHYYKIYFKYLPKMLLTEERIFFVLLNLYPELFKMVNLNSMTYKLDLMNYINS